MAPFGADDADSSAGFGRAESVAGRWEAKKVRANARREMMGGIGGMIAGTSSAGILPPAGKDAAPMGKNIASNPPGGRSQISFGDGAPSEQARPRRDASAPPCWQHQEQLEPVNYRCPSREPVCHAGGASSGNDYADALRAQIEAKKALRADEKMRALRADSLDDDRVARGASELRQEAVGEIAKQRQREEVVRSREDSLSRFLAERGGSEQGGERGFERGAEEDLELRRRAVPGLCGGREAAREAAGALVAERGPRRAHSRSPPTGSSPWAVDEKQAHAEPAARGRPPMAPESPEVRAGRGLPSSNWAPGAQQQSCGNAYGAEKPTSRVLRPPGGGGSLQIGSW